MFLALSNNGIFGLGNSRLVHLSLSCGVKNLVILHRVSSSKLTELLQVPSGPGVTELSSVAINGSIN